MALRLIKSCLEYFPREKLTEVGGKRRGVYVLYRRRGYTKTKQGKLKERYDVLYVGMADKSIRGRLKSHSRSKRKKKWTHFSAFAVWPNITKNEIRELEGLFRHIYRRDGRANILNLQRKYSALSGICARNADDWKRQTEPEG